MGIADRRREKLVEKVTAELEPGEQIRGLLPFAQTGPTPWFFVLTYLLMFFVRYLGFVATDRRVIQVKRGVFTNRIKQIEGSVPLDVFHIVEWKPNPLWSRLVVARPEGQLRLNVHRMHRADAEGFVAAVTAKIGPATWAPPVVGDPPHSVPPAPSA